MTVYDATNRLIDYFKKKDAFRVWDDFKELLIVDFDIESTHAAILAALNALVELKLVVKSRDSENEKDIYVLNRPLIMQHQYVNLEFGAIMRIIDSLSHWKDVAKVPLQIDPFNITQENLNILVGLANKYIEVVEKEQT